MAMFFNPIPLDGASFVENPAKTFVGRVARAIEYDQQLNNAYKSGKFFDDKANLELAIASAIDFHRTTGKQIRKGKAALIREAKKAGTLPKKGEAWYSREQALGAGAKNNPAPGLSRVTPGFKRALAYAMGRGKAYENAVARNRSRYLAAWAAKGVNVNVDRSGNATAKLRIKDRKGGVSVRGVTAEQAAKYLPEGVRGMGQRSLNATKNQWLLDHPGSSKEDRAALRAQISQENKAANASRVRVGGQESSPDAIAQALVSRWPAGGMDRYYKPLGLVRLTDAVRAERAATKSAQDATKVKYTNAKGVTTMVTPAQLANFKRLAEAAASRKKTANAKSNPFYEGDDYGSLALSNPSGVGYLDSIEDMVSRVPVIGEGLASVVAPAAGAAAAGAALYLIVPMVQDKLPEMLQGYAYATTGTALGVACAIAASQASGDARAALIMVGGAATTLGIGIDVLKRFTGGSIGSLALSGDMGDMGDTGSLALSGLGDTGSLALSGLGDGGAYQIQGLGSLGFAADHSALSSMYADACHADAFFSGADLDGVEGEAALAGATAYMGAFGASPTRAAGPKRAQSRHAGLRGHRWGWLIKIIGFEQFQKLAELPPEQRTQVIKQLREQAMASVAGMIDQAKAGAAASVPVPTPSALSGGYDPYGATLFSGSAF